MLPMFSTFSNYVTEEYNSHLLDLLIFIQTWISLFDKDMQNIVSPHSQIRSRICMCNRGSLCLPRGAAVD